MAKKKLGQGMDLLFMDSVEESSKGGQTLRISSIEPNKNQPRIHFDESAIITLADSIRQHGVLQPLLVRPMGNGSYQIVAGERRWRAARMAGLSEVPVVIKEMNDKETAQVALIENLQREDLNPIEEALGYQGLVSEYEMTQNEVAQIVGRSRAAVSNSLRLLELEESVQKMLENGEISVGHGKVILSLSDKKKQKELAEAVLSKGLTVRQTEQSAAKMKAAENGGETAENKKKTVSRDEKFFKKPTVFSELEIALSDSIGQKVTVNENGDGTSEMKITFDSIDSVKDFAKRLSDVWDK